MAAILTAAEMRALEREAIERGEVTGLELMERAGRGVVEAILKEWPEAAEEPQRVLVLCGPGNNGGDWFLVARFLKERGWDVRVWFHGDEDRLPPDASKARQAWRELGPIWRLKVPVSRETYGEVMGWAALDEKAPLYVVDALFGIGLRRSIQRSHRDWVDDLAMFLVNVDDLRLNEGGPDMRGVAIDIPSGVCADSGRILRGDELEDDSTDADDPRFFAFKAHLTVTFHSLKPGHLLDTGPRMCGKVVTVDLGLPKQLGSAARLVEQGAPWVRWVGKFAGHKYGYGHAVVLSGGAGEGGAVRMSARGALRIGAGLVTLAVPPAALQENAARLDAIMLRSIRNGEALADYLKDDRLNALAAGPGLGMGEGQAALIATLLDLGRPTVLDADALTLVSKDDVLRAKLHDKVVLTPHEGEFARLFPKIDAKWRAPATAGPAFSKVDAAREAAKEAGCVLLLKGPDTVIADPSGRAAINAAVYDRAAPWLATAGSGDVLAGFITGLLARGFQPFDAACTAAWLHVECARSFGPGLIAEDLPEELPKVFRALGL